MSQEEQIIKEIEETYLQAAEKIKELGKKRQMIISSYIRKLEEEKIKAIKSSFD